jgi:hypothetical protein
MSASSLSGSAMGDVKNHTLHRLDRMFAAAIGQRLTYKELIA